MPIMDMLPKGDTLQIPLDAPTSFSATAGNAQVELTWTDPLDKYATPEGEVSETGDQLVSEWDHTVLVRKTGSQPAGPNDGTVVVSSSVRNQYQTTAYVDSGLTNDTTYYYGVFAYNKDGVASPGAFTNATPKAGAPLSELTEGTIIKINENGSPVEFYLAKHNYEPDLNGQGRELVVRKNSCGSGVAVSGSSRDYEESTQDRWMWNTYKNRLSTAVKNAQGLTNIYALDYISGSPSGHVGTVVLDKSVFALSGTELGAPQGNFGWCGDKLPVADQIRKTEPDDYDGDSNNLNYWTRSYQQGPEPPDPAGCLVLYIEPDGSWNGIGSHQVYMAYRPAFTLPDTARVGPDLALDESSLTS